MRLANRFALCAAGAFVASFLTACGSGSSPALPANIRVVNLIPATVNNATTDTLTLTLNSTAYAVAAAPETTGTVGYLQVDPGTYVGEVELANDPSIAAYTFPGLGLGTQQYYSIVAYPRNGVLYPFELVDNVPVPGADYGQLTVANASPDAGAVDVYVTFHTASSPADPCSDLQAGTAPFQNVQGQQSSPIPYPVLNANTNTAYTYDVCVTEASNISAPLLSISSMSLSSKVSTLPPIQVLVLTSSAGGALVDAALVEQGPGGSVELFPNLNIRMRVITALGSGGSAPDVTVTTTAATTTLPLVYSGLESGYISLALGTSQPTVAVTVGGNAVPLTLPSGFTFTEGSDYTVLVYNATTPAATIFPDNNHFIQSRASIRMINAADTGSGTTLFVNNTVEASNVAYGTASTYYAVPTGTDTLQVLSSDITPPAVGTTGAGAVQTEDLIVGGVYTLFLYDITQPPILFEDR